MFENLLDLINENEIITIFRHTNPDYDAYGSQFGLKSWLNDNFPNKKVYAIGVTTGNLFEPCDIVDDKIIEDSLAIILDTSNLERIDDQRFSKAKVSVKIDHHPGDDNYAKYNYVNIKYAATCEAITDFISHLDQNKYNVSTNTAELLYRGLLTDTLSFKTNNTTDKTLIAASFLASKNIDLAKINRDVFNKSLDEFKYINFLRNKVIIDGKIACAYITIEDQKHFNIDSDTAKNYVSEFGNINEIEIWCIFSQKINENNEILWDGSLRSRFAQINDIAAKYQGGGHKNAAGCKNLTDEDLKHILLDFKSKI